jgi:dolichol-phosphate mannosyltransferase
LFLLCLFAANFRPELPGAGIVHAWYACAVNSPPPIELSVIAPAHNECENLPALIQEIASAIEPLSVANEIVIVDDGSTDDTLEVLAGLRPRYPQLRVIQMLDTPGVPGRGSGQSAAFHAGIRAARGRVIAMLDADLQNDPADIPRMLEIMRRENADLVQGDRSRNRRDTLVRRVSSWVGRTFRRMLLGDQIVDTGCSLRVIRRDVALRLPLEFRGVHRFIPVSVQQMGYRIVEVPVNHRPRIAGKAKYGVWNRAIPGLIDCFAVRWMRNRRRPVEAAEVDACSSQAGDGRGGDGVCAHAKPRTAGGRQPETSRP